MTISIMDLIVTLGIKVPLSVIMLNVPILSVAFTYCYAECHYVECRYAKCRCAAQKPKISKHQSLL